VTDGTRAGKKFLFVSLDKSSSLDHTTRQFISDVVWRDKKNIFGLYGEKLQFLNTTITNSPRGTGGGCLSRRIPPVN
jgi:hypothetical protein